MASLEMKIRLEREGLDVRIYSVPTNRLISTINLQEVWGLSDDNAAYVLRKLDEKNEQKERGA